MPGPVIRIRNEQGRIQFSSEAMQFQLAAKGTAYTRTDIKAGNTSPSVIIVPGNGLGNNTITAVRSTAFNVARWSTDPSGDTTFACGFAGSGAPVDWYQFTLARNFGGGGGPGLKLRNPSTGEVIYNSNYDSLIVAGQHSVLPGTQLILPSGRIYASVLPGIAGISETTETLYLNGRAYRDDGGQYPGDGYDRGLWERLNNGKLYGTRWTSDNVVTAGSVSFDDVRVQAPGVANQPDPARVWWETITDALAIDVTGL